MTGVSYHLSITKRGSALPNASGNVLLSTEPFLAQWKKGRSVEVTGAADGIKRRRHEVKGIRIRYANKGGAA
ncbi:hypothetical protein [Cohnella nanjingensis]|nr:hypothetical protein [Cohnella nanjingensis]